MPSQRTPLCRCDRAYQMTTTTTTSSMNATKAAQCCYFHATARAGGQYDEVGGWTSHGWVAYIATHRSLSGGRRPVAVLVRPPAE